MNINAGATLVTANFGLTFHGDFINAGTLTAGSSGITITGTTSSQNIAGFTTTGLVSVTKAGGTATFTGNVNGAGFTVNRTGGTLNLGTGLTHTFTGNFALAAGTLNGVTATLIIGGNGTAGGTFTAGTGTVNYNATAIQTVAPLTYNNLTLSGSSIKTFPAGTTTVNGILSMEGAATTTVTGTLTYGSSSTLQYKGSGAQTSHGEFVSPFPGSGGVKINNANGLTLSSARSLAANPLTIGDLISNSVFSDGGFALTATGTLNLTSGTYNVNYSSFPAFTTTSLATGTTVNYGAAATQAVKGITYSNLTISGAGSNSKIADGNITVNGILNLSSANASATQGCLDMNTTPFVLSMGANATTTGTGDVTGIVERTNGSFANNTPYSFGNQYTTITFLGISGGTKPGWLSCEISIGTAPTWNTGAIKRVYSFAQDVSATDQVTASLHYLNSELNLNTASNLVLWAAHNGPSFSSFEEHGKSNNDATNNWVQLSGLTVTYLAPNNTLNSEQWGLANSATTKNTWLGADNTSPTRWDLITNWSAGHVPLTNEDVLISGGLTYYPVLTLAVEVKTIEIESGASVTAGTYNMTLNGSGAAWNNTGTFYPGTGTVLFSNGTITNIVAISGTTNFYNVTVSPDTYLQFASGSYLKISGSASADATSIIDLQSNVNTVEYTGSGQSIQNPVGPSSTGYYNLIINGSGTTTFPSTLNVIHDFTLNGGTVDASSTTTIVLLGNVTLASGTTFIASSSAISVTGNWTNNSATFTPGTSTITFNNTSVSQSINGTVASQTFYNLIVAKTSQILSVGGATASLTVNNLTETSGNFTAPATLTINGSVTLTSGTLTAGSATTTVNGNATLTAGTYIPGITTNLLGNWTNNGATFTDANGTVNFNGSSAQTIGGSATNTFKNITVNNSAGVTASFDQTVNGVLNLLAANASSTKGSLDMGAHTLNMGPNGTNTGTGDVTGTVARSSFSPSVTYTYGNPYSTISFTDVGNLSFLSVTISLGAVPSWKTDAIQRIYSMTQTGAVSGTIATIMIHYLDTELNSNTESLLVPWTYFSGYPVTEGQRSNYDLTNDFITISNVDFYSFPSGTAFTLANTALTSCTWLGGTSTNWRTTSNWASAVVPTANSNVIIPSGTTYQPSLPDTTQISTIQIQSGATLNAVSGAKLTLNGGSGTGLPSELSIRIIAMSFLQIPMPPFQGPQIFIT